MISGVRSTNILETELGPVFYQHSWMKLFQELYSSNMAEEDVIVQLQDDRTVSRRLKEHLESLDKIICCEKNTDRRFWEKPFVKVGEVGILWPDDDNNYGNDDDFPIHNDRTIILVGRI